jgi:hypothetical protein
MNPSQILFYGGGAALAKYGTLSMRRATIARAGEAVQETFTRAGTVGTWIDHGGVIRKAEANVPRVNHWDTFAGAALTSPRLLVEGARTNLSLQNQDVSTTWVNTRTTDSVNADVAPDGTTTADRLIEDATASSTHYLSQTVTGTADASYAWSYFVKAGSRSWIALELQEAGGADYFRQYFDVTNGVVGTPAVQGTGVHSRSYIEPYGADHYRCTIVGTIGGGHTALRKIIYLATGDGGITYSGDGTSYVILWGSQFEDGAEFSSSYMGETTVASISRGAEVLSFPFYPQPQATTIYAKFIEAGGLYGTGGAGRVIQLGNLADATPNLFFQGFANFYRLYHENATAVASTMDTTPSIGNGVELLGEVFTDGSVRLTQSIDAATATSATRSAACTLATAWSGPVISIGNINGTSCLHNSIVAVIVARGSHSLDEFRALLP